MTILKALQRPAYRYSSCHFSPFSIDLRHRTARRATSETKMAQDRASISTALTAQKPPVITHILETCLMVKDVSASINFYKSVFSIEPFLNNVSLYFEFSGNGRLYHVLVAHTYSSSLLICCSYVACSPECPGFALSHTTLLLFQLGATAADGQMPDNGGTIPGHGPSPDVLELLMSKSVPDDQQPNGKSHRDSWTSEPALLSGGIFTGRCPGLGEVVRRETCQDSWQGRLASRWKEHILCEYPSESCACLTGCFRDLNKSSWNTLWRLTTKQSDPDGNVGEVGSRGIWEHY